MAQGFGQQIRNGMDDVRFWVLKGDRDVWRDIGSLA